jgi:hypothetical protein
MGFHSIDQHVDYSNLPTEYVAFIASLDGVSIPKCRQVAKEDPKRKTTMLEELRALDKNHTWSLCHYHLARRSLDANESSQ